MPLLKISKDIDIVVNKLNDLIDKTNAQGFIETEVDIPLDGVLHDLLEKLSGKPVQDKMTITLKIKIPK